MKGCLITILVVVGLLLFIGLFQGGGNGGNSSSSRSADDVGIAVSVTCENIVERQLKAPSTAKFSKYRESTYTPSSTGGTYRGYVDAENSFGAMLRSEFTCTYDKSTDNVRLVSFGD
jgi:hypothetical protein